MIYRNEAYFKKINERKGLGYALAGLAGLVALTASTAVGGLIYEKLRTEKPSLERTITAPENPKAPALNEDEDYEMPRLNPKIVPYEDVKEQAKPQKTIKTPVKPQTQKPAKRKEIIVLDPGHGMSNRTDGVYDPGAVSGEYKEAEIVLSQAEKVRDYLEAKGYTVYLTRENATTPTPLSTSPKHLGRIDIAKDKNADIFVSLHYNASDSADANGTEVLYNGEKSQKLAEQIHYSLVNAIDTTDRGIKERTDLRVLKSSIPSALVETGFLSNSKDRDKTLGTYADEQAIADGIDNYLNAGAK